MIENLTNNSNEKLPGYTIKYKDSTLPSYPFYHKKFTITTCFNLLKKISNCKWNIKEADSGIKWYKVIPTDNGLQVCDYNNSIVLETHLMMNLHNLVAFNIISPNQHIVLADVKITDVMCKIQINSHTSKQESIQYLMRKRKFMNSKVSLWEIFLSSSPKTILCSFNLKHNDCDIAEIKFNNVHLNPFEFHLFLIVACQTLSLVYS